MSNFDGGIRVSSFVAGGIVPSSRRGGRYTGLVAVFDWYASLCAMANVPIADPSAEKAGLPPVDGLDLSVALSLRSADGSGQQLRRELAIGTADAGMGFVAGMYYEPGGGKVGAAPLYKLLLGVVNQNAHSAALSPNRTENATLGFWGGSIAHPWKPDAYALDCGHVGCLFDVRADPGEAHDLSQQAKGNGSGVIATVMAHMHDRVAEYRATALLRLPGVREPAACDVAMGRYGGFYGPWIP
jgi:arylsulfatase B